MTNGPASPGQRGEWGLGRLLSMAARLVEQDWDSYLAARGLTHAGLVALHHLARGPGSQRELAAACMVEEQTMSRVLDKLARDGYVTRDRDSRDARRLLVQRTEAGARAWLAVTRSDASETLVRVDDPAGLREALVQIIAARLAARGQELPQALRAGQD